MPCCILKVFSEILIELNKPTDKVFVSVGSPYTVDGYSVVRPFLQFLIRFLVYDFIHLKNTNWD